MSRGAAPVAEHLEGLLLVDKPAGMTSHDVVSRCRRIVGSRRVGHAGTLDPAATGVLVLGTGRATRLLTYVVGHDKEYAATVRLGAATVTDDAEGEVVSRADAAHVAEEDLRAAVAALRGPQLQVPSSVSAVKVDGRRSYARVRGGEEVELAARPVTVSRFDVLDVRRGSADGSAVLDVDVVVECSAGTYVRALARDLGRALGVGGHLTALRRTRSGPFPVAATSTLEDLAARPCALPLAEAARLLFPVREVDGEEAAALGHGRALDLRAEVPGSPTAAISPGGQLLALLHAADGRARPLLVLPPR
ncbi:tRNA pseudouridine55 synthase [Kineococcus xinjiangensis]|uniref:tRNA pseudouridine synthase B n=1 Tax=Kineococcus xinjiangensis TaxID=512762 RepID=A0A2S6IWF5_9ACTN|nr:tRNA pseudouridine(55) synthase TruB [Kineococcus xinjiangensis]PPK98491.1 tRNA pseudouridine55 synthase [Kineococcus xinjiangensis]